MGERGLEKEEPTVSTPQEIIALAASEGAEFVDMRFTDVPGVQHHFSLPISQLTESVFEEGLGFDGSSVSGFQTIDASDMLLIPDPATAIFDPFTQRKTLVLLCDVKDPVTGEMYGKDPRGVVRRSLAYLASTRIADAAYFGPEAEFFIFDSVAFQNHPDVAGYQIRSAEGIFESGRPSVSGAPSPGHRIPYKGGYFPLAPMDTFQDLRSEMVVALESVGIPIEVQHHEVGTAGQAEIDMEFDEMLTMADKVQLYKYVVKNVARQHGCTATFMPKPIYGDNGSGMHTHQSLWRDGDTLMYDERGYAGLS
ncbi:MAG: glutamine synthetase beta-grasp domain-containing protein, partial [bacterium]|nr:glutamine synthetase beta-grasp domain-containing protein [bacterium]